nr:hypothetical protein [Acidobacteriota bacterium]
MRIFTPLTLAVLVAGSAVAATAQEPLPHQHTEPEKLGKVHFETSCRPAGSAAFDRAVALLHSFSFSSSKRAFDAILADDPACAMAYWGVAMSEWGNPFAGMRSGAMLERGGAAAARGLATGSPTPRERNYLTAVAALYQDHATVGHRTRIVNYERAMEALHATYPDDREATAFYALAVNQTALPTDKTFANQLKAAALLEALEKTDPDHPGLAHYIIHAYDVPPLAPRAVDAARRYAAIAPDAPHALHMPSHTFTRLGLWRESIESNNASAAAARRAKSPGDELHAYDYLVYAYLQTAHDSDAKRVIEIARAVGQANTAGGLGQGNVAAPAGGGVGAYALTAMPARYALERGQWTEAAQLQELQGATPAVQAMTLFTRALGLARGGGDLVAARSDLATLVSLQQKLAGNNQAYDAEQVEIQRRSVEAWILHA